ncbi:MAG: hypothetical protein A4E61_01937 [Syntrophorhabdus sp. PtaB.Bin184]|nr:MAG: hypothetical protein A4E61_01937 [Syntrophorhabdus sp. PtaB.Bin184]
MKTRDERDLIFFEGMTRAALEQEDSAAFVECLLKRQEVCERLALSSVVMEAEIAERFCANEMKVIERLEEERSKLLMEIDSYAQSRRAVRSYSPKFPLPPVPAFFSLKK